MSRWIQWSVVLCVYAVLLNLSAYVPILIWFANALVWFAVSSFIGLWLCRRIWGEREND